MSLIPFLILFLFTLIYYIPVLLNPEVILERGNDLEEVFWPVFYYIREQFIQTGTVPLWNNLFFAGTPLLPDPQFSLFYPFNWYFIIFPTDIAFISYFITHSLIVVLGMYLLTKYGFKFTTLASLLTAILYLYLPKGFEFLTEGHYGLFGTLAWLPLLTLSISQLAKSPKFYWAVLFAISLSGMFYTHTVVFAICLVVSLVSYIAIIGSEQKINHLIFKKYHKSISLIILGLVLFFGFCAVTLLPQIEWIPDTTRFILLQDKDTYPKWISKKEFVQASLSPWFLNFEFIKTLDTEKYLTNSFIVTILAIIGFWFIKIKFKILLLALLIPTVIISLNNVSPLYNLLLKQDFFILMRVSTRVWILSSFILIILSGVAINSILNKQVFSFRNKQVPSIGSKGRYRFLVIILVAISFGESIFLFNYRLKDIQTNIDNKQELYEFLKADNGLHRIYCTNRCISQKQAAIYGLQLVDGYNTLQQRNFYQQAWQLTGGYWNYYTLSIPPIGLYTFDKPQPDPKALGEYNTKYVISPYQLENPHFKLIKTIDNYFVYLNLKLLPRAYTRNSTPENISEVPILVYTPNYIKIDTSAFKDESIILSEVYSPGWNAYLNETVKVDIQQTPNALRSININVATKLIELKYQPNSFFIGMNISISTILITILITALKFRKRI